MNFSRHTCTLTPGLCCTLLACRTGPSQNGADINRPGCSHVSVYTGRPQSSTTRALDSLCTAKSHTIHLCFIQKSFSMHVHVHAHACMSAKLQSCWVMIKIPKGYKHWHLFLLLQSYLFCFNCVTQPFLSFNFCLFFFFFLLEPKESYLLHQLLHLQQSDSVPTNPSNLHWAQFYNTAAKTLKSFNVALRVPLKRALWCTPNINRTLGSWQTRPVYRQHWGHPDGSSQNMHLVTGASQKTEKLNSSYFWRWCLSCWLDSKLFANIGFEKNNK